MVRILAALLVLTASIHERIGIPRSDPRASGLNACEGVVERHPPGQIPPEWHATCLQSLTAIDEHLQANRTDIVQRTSQHDFDIAVLRAAGLRSWEHSAFTIADDFTVGFNHAMKGWRMRFTRCERSRPRMRRRC
jgi:hypothetical protein